MTDERTVENTARTYARTAGAACGDAARYLRTIPAEEWNGPTGCTKWDIRTLAGHVAGEAVWFPNLTRGVTRHEAPYPNELYASLKTLPPHRRGPKDPQENKVVEFRLIPPVIGRE